MAINKVVRKSTGDVLLDLTQDTVTAETLSIGVTAHNAAGEPIVGECAVGGVTIKNQNKTITENGTYSADSGYTGLGTVTVDVQASGGNTVLRNVVVPNSIWKYTNTLYAHPDEYEMKPVWTDGELQYPVLKDGDIITFSNDIVIPDEAVDLFLNSPEDFAGYVEHQFLSFVRPDMPDLSKEKFVIDLQWNGVRYVYSSSVEAASASFGITVEQCIEMGFVKGWYKIDFAAGAIIPEIPSIVYLEQYNDSAHQYGIEFVNACGFLLDLTPFGLGKVTTNAGQET